jgi:structural maintenance of chromosome 1
MVLERKIAKHKADADKRNPTAVKTKEETLRAKKKLELASKQLEKHTADAEQSAEDIRRLESDLANVNAAEAAFEREFAEDIAGSGAGGSKSKSKKQKTGAGGANSSAAAGGAASGGLDLGAAQIEAYNKKKEEAGAKTFKLRQERDGLASAAQADEAGPPRRALTPPAPTAERRRSTQVVSNLAPIT